MPLDFPSSPVNGQVYQNYVWSSTDGVWRASNSAQTFPVQVSNGGTGAGTVAGAQDSLNISIIQAVTNQYSTEVFSTSTSYVSTGLTATITPKYSTSKILIISHTPSNNNGTASGAIFTIFRGTVSGTNLGSSTAGGAGFAQLYSGAGSTRNSVTMTYADSPSTTSPVTYTIAFASGSAGAHAQHEGRRASLTLLEIKA